MGECNFTYLEQRVCLHNPPVRPMSCSHSKLYLTRQTVSTTLGICSSLSSQPALIVMSLGLKSIFIAHGGGLSKTLLLVSCVSEGVLHF